MTARAPGEVEGIPTIDLSPGGAASKLGVDAVAEQAAAAVAGQGCVRLLGAFDPALLAQWRGIHDRDAARRLPRNELATGHRRLQITLAIRGALNTPAYYANPYAIAIARRVLGAECILGRHATVLACPDSAEEVAHRDQPTPFGDDRYDTVTPAHGIEMILPFDASSGGAECVRIWPGTQNVADHDEARRMASVEVELPIGSCLLFDTRTLHAGCGNRAKERRSVAAFTYHRSWYRAWDAVHGEPPIRISRRELRKVPAAYRHLFEWRFDRYARQRVRLAMRRLASRAMPAIEWVQRRPAR